MIKTILTKQNSNEFLSIENEVKVLAIITSNNFFELYY